MAYGNLGEVSRWLDLAKEAEFVGDSLGRPNAANTRIGNARSSPEFLRNTG